MKKACESKPDKFDLSIKILAKITGIVVIAWILLAILWIYLVSKEAGVQ